MDPRNNTPFEILYTSEDELQQQIQAAEKKAIDAVELQTDAIKKFNAIELQLNAVLQEKAELLLKLADSQKTTESDIEKLNQRISDLQQQKDEANALVQKLTAEMEILQEKMIAVEARAKSDNVISDNIITELRRTLSLTEQDRDAGRNTIIGYEELTKEMKTELGALKKQVGELQSENQELLNKLAAAKAKHLAASERAKSRFKKLTKAQKRKIRHQEKLEKVFLLQKISLDETFRQLDEKEESLNKLDADYKSLQKKLTEVTTWSEHFENLSNKYEDSLIESQSVNQQLNEELDDVIEENEAYRQELDRIEDENARLKQIVQIKSTPRSYAEVVKQATLMGFFNNHTEASARQNDGPSASTAPRLNK